MRPATLSFEEWRRRARPLLMGGVKPDIAVPAIAAADPVDPSILPSSQLEVSGCSDAFIGKYQLLPGGRPL